MEEIKHEVVVNGTPKLENMPKDVLNVFCNSILAEIEIYYGDVKKEPPNSFKKI